MKVLSFVTAAFFVTLAVPAHAVVEDRVRTNKAIGLRNLPSKTWAVNRGWVLAANIAVVPPMIPTTASAVGAYSNSGDNRATMNTPAVTIVAA